MGHHAGADTLNLRRVASRSAAGLVSDAEVARIHETNEFSALLQPLRIRSLRIRRTDCISGVPRRYVGLPFRGNVLRRFRIETAGYRNASVPTMAIRAANAH